MTIGTPRRAVAVLTTGRQDWGILHSTCSAIAASTDLDLRLWVGGTHLSRRHGFTVDQIRADGFVPDAEFAWLDGSDDPPADRQAADALALVGAEMRSSPVEAIVLVGDRLETAAAALAATVDRVPIVHVHGGEQTLGAFDDALRHAITKLSHLHLVSNDEHARRVIALGEDPATVHVVGSPGTDSAFRTDLPDRATLAAGLGLDLTAPVVVVTVHPATLDLEPAASAIAVAEAMDLVAATYVITLPNTDPGAADVRRVLLAAAARPGRIAVEALGEARYWGLLRIADAVLGNSSSALVEAPVVGLPAVNVGDRQEGRHRASNVIDAPADTRAVAVALREALSPSVHEAARLARPPLADGRAGQRIADIIAAWHPTVPPRKAPIRLPE